MGGRFRLSPGRASSAPGCAVETNADTGFGRIRLASGKALPASLAPALRFLPISIRFFFAPPVMAAAPEPDFL